jgi:hypothetical protein
MFYKGGLRMAGGGKDTRLTTCDCVYGSAFCGDMGTVTACLYAIMWLQAKMVQRGGEKGWMEALHTHWSTVVRWKGRK